MITLGTIALEMNAIDQSSFGSNSKSAPQRRTFAKWPEAHAVDTAAALPLAGSQKVQALAAMLRDNPVTRYLRARADRRAILKAVARLEALSPHLLDDIGMCPVTVRHVGARPAFRLDRIGQAEWIERATPTATQKFFAAA